MRREYFDREWALFHAQWPKDCTKELSDVWFRSFENLSETVFRRVVDTIITTAKGKFPTIGYAFVISKELRKSGIANADAIKELYGHAMVLFEKNSTMCESTVRTLVEIHTGDPWVKAVTKESVAELKAMLDKVEPFAWEVLEYCSQILNSGIIGAEEALISKFGTEMATSIIVKARKAMPNVDTPPQNISTWRPTGTKSDDSDFDVPEQVMENERPWWTKH